MPISPPSGTSAQAFASGGVGPTAQQLIRGLGKRSGEFVLANPESSGSPTQLVDHRLLQYFPVDIAQWYGWISGVPGSDASNVGLEYRGSSWTASNATVTLFAPGFPVPIRSGEYEIHMRYQRSMLLEAINDAVGQLQLSWYREVEDTSLVTTDQKWEYVAPATQHWTGINRIEIQINTDATATAGGYPFASADYLNPRVDRAVDNVGVEVWSVRFGMQPPPGRVLRLRGEAYYTDLVQDTDFIPLAGEWQRPALTWIYSWAQFQLQDWTNNRPPTEAIEKTRAKAADLLERQKNQLLATAPSHKPGKIVTPGRGDGYAVYSPDNARYLGAFKSAAFTRGGG